MYKIFLVEDDFYLADAMKSSLNSYDYDVTIVKNFQNVISEFNEIKPDLVLLDIMLPFKDGYFWCNEIRKISSVPVIFISSASDNMNIVMAINMGADDFIPKPVDAMVLVAKIGATLRRTYEINSNTQIIEFYGAKLNISDYTITNEDKKVELTKNEFKILQVLLNSKGKIVSREALMTRLWESDLFVEENTLSVNVGRLRKKLSDIGLSEIIITKPGSGYIIK